MGLDPTPGRRDHLDVGIVVESQIPIDIDALLHRIDGFRDIDQPKTIDCSRDIPDIIK